MGPIDADRHSQDNVLVDFDTWMMSECKLSVSTLPAKDPDIRERRGGDREGHLARILELLEWRWVRLTWSRVKD